MTGFIRSMQDRANAATC